jgi:hypothetical protein
MRPRLVSCFDIGESYGLGDEVFPEGERAALPDIGMVGIQFPLGAGLRVDLLDDRVAPLWREAAVAQVARPEMELGWSPEAGVGRSAFLAELERLIGRQALTRCELYVHAVGTVYAQLQFGPGVPLPYLHGLLACFEFAGYTPPVADAVWQAAHRRVEAALGPGLTGLVALTRRPLPDVLIDAKGYAERMLFPWFTHVVACVDEGDEEHVASLKAAMSVVPGDSVEFEHHGTLHFGPGYVIEPKQIAGWRDEGGEQEPPERQILRMEADVRVAHVFNGACDAFKQLFVNEVHEQVGGYVAGDPRGRSPVELNRLRALALAVVSLTDFDQVTVTDEDHEYFRRFSDDAGIERKHRSIQEATNVLYNVQAAELQNEEARRQTVLNWIVLLLTSLSVISVAAVGYDFIREDASLIAARAERAWVFALLTLVVALLVVVVMLVTRPPNQRRRRRRAL